MSAPTHASSSERTADVKPVSVPARPQAAAPVQDLFSVPSGSPRGRTELPITAPSPILAMQPQVAAEVAKTFANKPDAEASSASENKVAKSTISQDSEKSATDES